MMQFVGVFLTLINRKKKNVTFIISGYIRNEKDIIKEYFSRTPCITTKLIALISLSGRCVAVNTTADRREDIKTHRYFYLKAATSCADAKVSACRAIQPPALRHDVIGHLASSKQTHIII